MAYILEETKGNLPTWLAPVQARVIPVKTDDNGLNAYAKEIVDALEAADVRVELDDRSEKLGYRMRDGQVQKVPYLLVIGFNEKDNRSVSFRLHGEKETNVLPLDEFVEAIKKEMTVPCKIRHYDSKLSELRAPMGANIHRRNISAFDMARQLETLRSTLAEEGGLPDNVKEQSELMASQVDLSRATVERYLDLLNLDETVTAWAENGQMTMTDAYELARQKNMHLQPAVEEYVARNDAKGDLPALVHRAIAWAKTAELPPPPAKPAQSANPLRTVDSFGRSVRRSIAQLKELDLSTDVDKDTARKKLDTCLENLEELRRTVETLKMVLDD